MREAHPVERAVGIEQYVTDAPGTGGRLRAAPEEFRVRELESFDVEPADADPGAYPHLVLRATLAGWDTNDFARALSDRLGISRERVSWAGTKDKYAVTTQLFSVRAPEFGPADVPALDDATIEVVGRAGRALQFGDLAGNAFRIVVRDPDDPENAAAVIRELRAFAARGGVAAGADVDSSPGASADADGPVAVPNYFGQQRFGSRRAITHEVGLAIVRREYREAVLAYAGNPSEHEPADSSEARRAVERAADRDPPDWEAALAALPGRLGYERAMLQVLAERDAGRDDSAAYRAALEAVPSNLQRLFVNAAQSYAFNRIVSERLRRGLPLGRPVAGDLVCFADEVETGAADGSAVGDCAAPAPTTLAVPDPDRTQRVTAERVDTVARHCERGRAFVTAPLVGTETTFADGEPGEIERDVCERVGIAPDAFDLPEPFASRGTRRAVLVRTDVDLTYGGDGGDGGGDSDGNDGNGRDDSYALGFALPKGSYATVVLREYLKSGPLDL